MPSRTWEGGYSTGALERRQPSRAIAGSRVCLLSVRAVRHATAVRPDGRSLRTGYRARR